MSAYGQFESGSCFCDGGQIVLFNAHSKDASDSREYIVRVFKNTTEDTGQLNCFLSNSQAQAGLTEKGQAKHWVPIIETGSIGSQGYSVQPKYELNLEDFIGRSKFALTDAILRRFVSGIIAGLKEAEKLGPHGNLKPANVLLEAPDKWSEAVVKLTDAHFHLSADLNPGSDFKALVRIVYFLVTGKAPALSLRRVSTDEVWSLQNGDASGWKDFCNQLLADAETLTLADVQVLLDRVPVVSRRADLMKKGSFFLLFCCLLGVGLWWINRVPTVDKIPEHSIVQWQTLVESYDSWLKAVESSIEDAEDGDEEMQFWLNDKYLKEKVVQWYRQELDNGMLIDPWLVIDKKVPYQDLLPAPKVLRKVSYLERLEESDHFVEELRSRIGEWTAPARLETISKEFEKLGLKRPADEIMQIVEQFDRNIDGDVIRQLKLIYETERNAKSLRDTCKQLWTRSKALSKKGRASGELSKDMVLLKLADYPKNSWVAADSLGALQDTTKSLSQQIKSIGDIVVSKTYREEIDLKLFREQSEVNRTDEALSVTIIEAWCDEILQYKRLSAEENPLRIKLWKDEEMKVRKVAAELAKVKDELELKEDDLEKVLAILDAIEKGQDVIFKNQEQILQKPPIVKFSHELNSLNSQVLSQWDSLLQQAQQAMLEVRPDPDKWLAKVLADAIPNDEVLNNEWILRRDAILEATPRSQWEDDLRVFGSLQREISQLRNFFGGLLVEQTLSATSLPSQGIDSPVHKQLELFLKELRKELLNDIFQSLTPEIIEAMDATKFIAAPEQRALLERYKKLKSEVVLFGQDVRKVKNSLARGESYGKLPEEFWSKWRDHTALKRLRNYPEIKPLFDQLKALEQLYESPVADPTTLLTLMSDKDAPLANAVLAWRKLEKVHEWPRTVDELESELSAFRTLLDREDVTTREMLIEEGRQRWLTRAEQLESKQELETAFRFLPEYRVKPSQLDPLMHFRYFIFSELSALSDRPGINRVRGDTVTQWKSEFLARIRGNQQWDELDEAKGLIEQLEAFQLDRVLSPPSATELGPGLKGWEVVRGEVGNEEIVYQWSSSTIGRSYELDFIEVEGMTDICYVSRTEVSMGLFRDWVEQESGWGQWHELISEMDIVHGFEMRAGPRVWEVVQRSIKVPADGWIYPLPGWPDTLYFGGYRDELPTEDHPMQYISPEFALKFAHSLNCILPTPAQWGELHRDHADLSPNRRDPSWMKQQAHVATNFNLNHAWADLDSFGPTVDPTILTGMAAIVVKNVADDGKVWFSKIDDGARGSQFSHLTGNVAEYLHDESGFYVGGASALSAPSIKPSEVYPLIGVTAANGFSDVGIRLAFVVKRKLAGQEFVNLLKDYYSRWTVE